MRSRHVQARRQGVRHHHGWATDAGDAQNTWTWLLAALAEAKLPMEAANYIADALVMSDNFEWSDDAVAEALFFLSDES